MLPCVDITNGAVCKIYPDNIENVISKSDYVDKNYAKIKKGIIRTDIKEIERKESDRKSWF